MQKKQVSIKVTLITLGCKVNQYESAAIAEEMERRGFSIVPFGSETDCYIINTCTVTAATNYQSRQLIRRANRKNPQAPIMVTGCYAQINPGDIAAIPGVVVIAGNTKKEKLPDVIETLIKLRTLNQAQRGEESLSANGKWLPPRDNIHDAHKIEKNENVFVPSSPIGGEAGKTSLPRREGRKEGENGFQSNKLIMVDDIMRQKTILPLNVTRFPDHTRAFLKIQDGCDSFCSYCIVPFARGPSRSLPEADVIAGISRFGRAGHREVVLTGIHLGHYGHDLTPRTTLLRILEEVERQKIVERLRLSSIEATEITDDLIAFMRKSKTLCRHLHVPLQSGDSRILALMGRNYDAPFMKSLLDKLLKAIPDIAVGMDVMVGFPGEDEEAFQNTRRLIEELPVAYLHVFPYSERPGTRAVRLSGKVKDKDKKRRAEILRTLGKNKRKVFAERFIGKELSVLVEDIKKKDKDWITGFSGNYIPVMIESSCRLPANTIIRVVPESVRDGKLYTRQIINEQ